MAHRRSNRLAGIVVAFLLATAAPALAAPSTVTRFVPSHGEGVSSSSFGYAAPKLAGSSVVWARNLHAGGWVVERGAPGTRTARLARSRRPRATTHQLTLFDASSSRVAWSDYAYDVVNAHAMDTDTVRSRLHTAALANGTSTAMAGCGDGLPPCECPPYCGYADFYRGDVDGGVIAYIEGHYLSPTVVVDDLASPADPVRIDRGKSIDAVVIAGNHLAWAERALGGSTRIVVYDWRAGREVYGVDGFAIRAVQADGKITTADSNGQISWHAPSDPAPHPIERPGRYVGGVRMADDRLLFADRAGVGGDIRLVSADLAGSVTEVAAGGGGLEPEAFGAVDFDGRRATWAARRCGIVSIVIAPDVTKPGGDPPPRACSPPLIGDQGFATGGRLVARVTCEKGCRGKLGLYDLSSHPRLRLARRSLDLRPSPAARKVVFTPTAAQRRRVAKLEEMRVQTIFSGRDGAGQQVGATKAGTLKRP